MGLVTRTLRPGAVLWIYAALVALVVLALWGAR